MTLQTFNIRRPIWCASGSAGYIQAARRLLTWLAWERSAVGAREEEQARTHTFCNKGSASVPLAEIGAIEQNDTEGRQ
jgi:hypothetical protein